MSVKQPVSAEQVRKYIRIVDICVKCGCEIQEQEGEFCSYGCDYDGININERAVGTVNRLTWDCTEILIHAKVYPGVVEAQ